eukprot:CFRG6270T1
MFALRRTCNSIRSCHISSTGVALTQSRLFMSNPSLFSSRTKDEERLLKKKKIVEEIDRGYFGDYKEFNMLGGAATGGQKLWTVASELTKPERSMLMPKISGKALSGRKIDSLSKDLKGKVSLVLVAIRDISRPQLEVYEEYFKKTFSDNSATQIVEVSLIERAIYRWLSFLLHTNLKNVIKDEIRQNNFVVCDSPTQDIVKKLDISNPLYGYAYLVDGQGRIRWRCHGTPEGKELVILKELTETLLRRM